jgi:hypothetical protein
VPVHVSNSTQSAACLRRGQGAALGAGESRSHFPVAICLPNSAENHAIVVGLLYEEVRTARCDARKARSSPGVSTGARVDARRTCQEPRLTDHARRHGCLCTCGASAGQGLRPRFRPVDHRVTRRQPIAAPCPRRRKPGHTRRGGVTGDQIGRSKCTCGRYLTFVCAGPGGIDRPTCE